MKKILGIGIVVLYAGISCVNLMGMDTPVPEEGGAGRSAATAAQIGLSEDEFAEALALIREETVTHLKYYRRCEIFISEERGPDGVISRRLTAHDSLALRHLWDTRLDIIAHEAGGGRVKAATLSNEIDAADEQSLSAYTDSAVLSALVAQLTDVAAGREKLRTSIHTQAVSMISSITKADARTQCAKDFARKEQEMLGSKELETPPALKQFDEKVLAHKEAKHEGDGARKIGTGMTKWYAFSRAHPVLARIAAWTPLPALAVGGGLMLGFWGFALGTVAGCVVEKVLSHTGNFGQVEGDFATDYVAVAQEEGHVAGGVHYLSPAAHDVLMKKS